MQVSPQFPGILQLGDMISASLPYAFVCPRSSLEAALPAIASSQTLGYGSYRGLNVTRPNEANSYG